MTDIFVSYAHEDASVAEALAVALTARGWSVWIDRTGIDDGALFDEQIEAAISSATVVLVIWSQASVKSRWVRAEAAFALEHGSLVPVAIDSTLPPLQFLHVQHVDLVNWDGDPQGQPFVRLSRALSRRLRAGGALALRPSPTPEDEQEAISREGMSLWHRLMVSLGLRFPSAHQERQFQEKLAGQIYPATQGGLIAAITILAFYGLTDMAAGANSAWLTRIRFMVLIPALILLYALSRTSWARARWQITVPTFVLAAEGVALVMIYYIATQTAFGAGAAVPAMNIMVVFGVVALIPLRALVTLLVSLPILVTYLLYVASLTTISPTIVFANAVNPIVAFGLSVAASFVRERASRRSFVADLALSDSVATLREALLRLGAEKRSAGNRTKRQRQLRRAGAKLP